MSETTFTDIISCICLVVMATLVAISFHRQVFAPRPRSGRGAE